MSRRGCDVCGEDAPLYFVPERGSCCPYCAALAEDEDIVPGDLDRIEGERPSALLLRVVRALSEKPPEVLANERQARDTIEGLVSGLRGERLAWATRLVEVVAGMP